MSSDVNIETYENNIRSYEYQIAFFKQKVAEAERQLQTEREVMARYKAYYKIQDNEVVQ